MIPNGRGTIADFIAALEWAGSRTDIQIVNVSAGLQGYVDQELLRVAIADLRAAGVLPIVAVGNEGWNRTRSPGNYSEVISVGAADDAGKIPAFSGSGTIVAGYHQYTVPTLVAPGKGIWSSVMGGSYEPWAGTSMAAPIVSGVAALVLEKYPTLELLEIEEQLRLTCKALRADAARQGAGLVQVAAAV